MNKRQPLATSTIRCGAPGAAPAPKVSVLMRTYNTERFVGQAIGSVLEQKFDAPYELLISDDCSADGTPEIVAEYARRRPDIIRAFLRRERLGILANLMEIFREAHGEYVAILDGDDWWTSPHKLAKVVNILDSEPDVAAVVHDVEYVTEEGDPAARPRPVPRRTDYTTADLLHGIAGCFSTLVFRRVPVRTVLAEKPWLSGQFTADWTIQIIAAQLGKVRRLGDRMTAYRISKGAVWTSRSPEERLPEIVTFYKGIQGYVDPPDQRRAAALQARCQIELARLLARRGERAGAWSHVLGALRASPLQVAGAPGVAKRAAEALMPGLFARWREWGRKRSEHHSRHAERPEDGQ